MAFADDLNIRGDTFRGTGDKALVMQDHPGDDMVDEARAVLQAVAVEKEPKASADVGRFLPPEASCALRLPQWHPLPGDEGEFTVDWARTGQASVDDRRKLAVFGHHIVRRKIVVTYEWRMADRRYLPDHRLRRIKVRNGAVILRRRSTYLLEEGFAPYPPRPGVGVTDSVAGNMLKNLATCVVVAERLWS
jgi:hypothetical protein